METLDEKENLLFNIFEPQLTIVHEIFAFLIDIKVKYTCNESLSKIFCPLPGLEITMVNKDDLNEILTKQYICNLIIAKRKICL